MIRPPYAVLRSKYPDRRSVCAEELYQWIGHPEYIGDVNWANTCDRQGHIDMVAPHAGDMLMCEEDCYWSSTEVWFWPLK